MNFENLKEFLFLSFYFVLLLLIVKVDTQDCSAFDCKSCRNISGCGWCEKSKKCLVGNESGPSANSSCTDGSCWSFGENTCADECTSIDVCTICSSKKNCYWCGKTHRCLLSINNTDSGSIIPCGENCGFNTPVDCWKANVEGNCPNVSYCGNITNCRQCTSSSCFWCGNTKQCMESTVGITQPCGFNGENCSDTTEGCWKENLQQCPAIVDCGKVQDCLECTRSGCGWCTDSMKCLEIKNNRENSCGNDCHRDYQCWIIGEFACPTKDNKSVECSSFDGNCTSCTQASLCGFCAESNKCFPTQGSKFCYGDCTAKFECSEEETSSKEMKDKIIIISTIGTFTALVIFVFVIYYFFIRRKGYVQINDK